MIFLSSLKRQNSRKINEEKKHSALKRNTQLNSP